MSMIKNEIKLFNSPKFGEVRTVVLENEPWFIASDICNVLGLTNATKAIQNLDNDERSNLLLGRQGNTNIINESGLYTLIIRSNKPEAKIFKKWVTQEVLPSIRKSGGYITAHADDTPELIMARALQVAQTTIEQHQQRLALAENSIREQAPKVEYYEEVLQSASLIATNVIAKELGMSAITLNRKLHNLKVLYKSGKTWVLYEKYNGRGYTKTKTHHYLNSLGVEQTHIQTYWTEMGREFIINLINGKGGAL